MKVQLLETLKSVKGQDLIDGEGGKPITLEAVILSALTTPTRNDQSSSLDAKVSVFKLAQKVASANAESVDLSPEDVSIIRGRINDVFASPIVVGAALEHLG